MRNAVISLALVLLFAPAALADMTGPATVIEGDLIEIMGERVRLYGIDAPERGQRCTYLGKTFDCGHIAKTALMDLTAGATIVCRPTGKKRKGGLVARCFADGFDLSENMVHTGWALAEPREGARYRAKERQAERAKRGLWRGTFVAPWEWREGKRRP